MISTQDIASLTSTLLPVVVQVVNLTPGKSCYIFSANNGKMKIKGTLPATNVTSAKIQNLGLIRLVDYVVHEMPQRPEEKYLIIRKCEIVADALDSEIKIESKAPEDIIPKPTQKFVTRSASQIINEQMKNADPVARLAIKRRVHPLMSLDSHQRNWTIKVSVSYKGAIKNYDNSKGKGCALSVELTDVEGTQIQATMFNAAANKFFDIFQMGKVYYISKGSLKLAKKEYTVVPHDYEMILNENSEVEEAI